MQIEEGRVAKHLIQSVLNVARVTARLHLVVAVKVWGITGFDGGAGEAVEGRWALPEKTRVDLPLGHRPGARWQASGCFAQHACALEY